MDDIKMEGYIPISELIHLSISNEKKNILLNAIFEEASINYNRDGLILDVETSKHMFDVIKVLYPDRYARELLKCKKEAEEYAGD